MDFDPRPDVHRLRGVVADHSSTDDTWDRLQPFARTPGCGSSRLRPGGGAPANWKRVTDEASGELVKLVCGDDLITPDCLAEEVAAMDSAPGIVLVSCMRDLIDARGNQSRRRAGLAGLSGRVPGREAARRAVMAGTNIFGEPGCVLMRRDALEAAGGWADTEPYVIDQQTFCNVLMQRRLLCASPRTLASFRMSASQWSVNLARQQADQVVAFHQRLAARQPGTAQPRRAHPRQHPGPWHGLRPPSGLHLARAQDARRHQGPACRDLSATLGARPRSLGSGATPRPASLLGWVRTPDTVHRISIVMPVYQGGEVPPGLARGDRRARRAQRHPGRPQVRRRRVAARPRQRPRPLGRRHRRARAASTTFVRPVWLSRNYGQHPATLAGMASSSGDWIVTLDEDGQHDPADIGLLPRHRARDERPARLCQPHQRGAARIRAQQPVEVGQVGVRHLPRRWRRADVPELSADPRRARAQCRRLCRIRGLPRCRAGLGRRPDRPRATSSCATRATVGPATPCAGCCRTSGASSCPAAPADCAS